MASAATTPPALPIALLLCLLASSATCATPDAQPPLNADDSKPGLSKSTALTGERVASAPVMDAMVAAAGDEGEDDAAVGEHRIRVRDAGPVRFWSGSRYGRSAPETGSRSDGSTLGMAMSLRSSGPAIQPRHDRFFLGSRYGKRAQGWRRAAEEDEEGVEEERAGGEEEAAARTMNEILRLRALPGDSDEVFGVTSQRVSSALQPTSCIYTGIGNLYRCYEGRREGGVH